MKTILTQKGSRLNVTVSGLDVYVEGSDGMQYEVRCFFYDVGTILFEDGSSVILADLESKQVMQESLDLASDNCSRFLRSL